MPALPHRRSTLVRVLAVLFFLAAAALAGFVIYRTTVAPPLDRQVAVVPALVRAEDAAHHTSYTPVSAISPLMQHAVVAIEDRRFYQHHGIDVRSLLREAVAKLVPGHADSGGSTIDMQLIKKVVFHGSVPAAQVPTLLGLSWELENRYRKSKILELYLNALYFGRGAYGIAQAAQTYFHQTPAQLDVAHAAFLAALIQLPSTYGSHPHSVAMEYRQRLVIHDLQEQGYISARQELAAQRERLHLIG